MYYILWERESVHFDIFSYHFTPSSSLKSEENLKAVETIPLDRMLLETGMFVCVFVCVFVQTDENCGRLMRIVAD